MTSTVSFLPPHRFTQHILAFLYLLGLPKQSLLNNPTTRIINGQEMIECLKLEIKTSSTDSHIELTPLHHAIGEKMYVGREKKTCVTVINHSEAERKFWVEKIKDEPYVTSKCEVEGEVAVKPS
jgi:hypothetical protein